MQRIFAFTVVVVGATATAILTPPEPVATKEYAVCRLDYDSGIRSCAFETIDQCVSAIAGRGGSCVRSPASEASALFAHATQLHARHRH
ncbi:hypothetical protein XH88_00070 [Bradyrhizobium sp. CCBAU 51627]|nr:hypothetical protein [Bradyrhizobium sp. CCBAU 51627]